MMPQISAVARDEQTIAQAELEQYITQQANYLAPEEGKGFSLEVATQDILSYANFMATKKTRDKTEFKQLLNDLGWKGEEKKYLKVAAAFENFSPQELAGVEPATIFRLANNPKKYQPVIDELLDLPEITQAAVRDLIAAHRTVQEPSSLEPSIWRRTKNGARYCQIPPIHEQDEQTGVILQQAMDDGLLPQAVVREAMQLWLDYQQGRLEFVEAAALPKEMPTFVEPEVQHEDLLTELLDEAYAIPDLAAEPYSVEELESFEQCEGDRADYWTFEPEPEKDDTVPFTSNSSSGESEKQAIASHIKNFIRNPAIASLTEKQDDRFSMYLFGGIFVTAGLIPLLARVVTCVFDKTLDTLTVKRQGLLGTEFIEHRLREIKDVLVEESTDSDGSTYRVTILLVSGSLPLTYYYSSCKARELETASYIRSFLNLDN